MNLDYLQICLKLNFLNQIQNITGNLYYYQIYFRILKALYFFRYYTKFFDNNGTAGPKIMHYSMQNFKNWEQEIEKWQNPILNNP